MKLVEIIESRSEFKDSRNLLLRSVLAVLALIWLFAIARFYGLVSWSEKLTDFDCFYIVGRMARAGLIDHAYYLVQLAEQQEIFTGSKSFMPWTYPPQFNLVVELLASLPLWLAFLLFTTSTAVMFLVVLRLVAREYAVMILIVMFPVIALLLRSGQNGFLTASLVGLACLGLQKKHPIAGVPLGLMIIKPHLAVALAVYVLVKRLWGVMLVALLTVALTSTIATLVYGVSVWDAFFHGVKESGVFLNRGFYPLFRMVSPYAALRTFHAPAQVALLGQCVIAVVTLCGVAISARSLKSNQSLGLAVAASLLISPYAYDYDMLIYGIGLSLLLPDIIRLSSEKERLSIYALTYIVCGYGMVLSLCLTPTTADHGGVLDMPSVGGVMQMALLWMIWRIIRRDRTSAAPHQFDLGDENVGTQSRTFVRSAF